MITPIHHLTLNLETLPPIMTRGEHVLILLVDENGHFVLGKKDLYPEGIVRMVGGGTDGEDPTTAALREIQEEVGLHLHPDQLLPLGTIVAEVSSQTPTKQVTFTTYLFATKVNSAKLVPDDDLDGLQALTRPEYDSLVDRYFHLSPSIQTSANPGLSFSWADYGKLYGQVHEWALKRYQEL